MAAVPLILDRVYKAITETMKKRGPGFEKIFKFCYEYRLAATLRGESTPMMDLLIFSKLRAAFGGRLRYMMTGKNRRQSTLTFGHFHFPPCSNNVVTPVCPCFFLRRTTSSKHSNGRLADQIYSGLVNE